MKKYSCLSLFSLIAIGWILPIAASKSDKTAHPSQDVLLRTLKTYTRPHAKNQTRMWIACKNRAAWYETQPTIALRDIPQYVYVHTIVGIPCNSDIVAQSTMHRLRHLERATQGISDFLEYTESTPFLEHAFIWIDMHTPRKREPSARATKEKT